MASLTPTPIPSFNLFLPGKSSNPLLWTCTLCATTVNIFALSDHAASRSHLARVTAEEKRKTGIVEGRWLCEICKVDIAVGNKEEHLTSWRHLVNVRETETVKEEDEDLLVFDYVGRGVKRTTFYCLKCRSEFSSDEWEEHLNGAMCQVPVEEELDGPEHEEERESREEKEDHHQEGDYIQSPIDCPIPGPQLAEAAFLCVTCDRSFPLSVQPLHMSHWRCPICNLIMHKHQKDSHIATLDHRPSAANDDWHCNVCNRTYKLGGKAGHEEGGKHLKRLQSIKDAMTTAPSAHTDTNLPDEPAIRLGTPQEAPETGVDSEAASAYSMSSKGAHKTTGNHSWYCEPCGKTVSLVGREGHESGATHRSKVSERANMTAATVKAPRGKQPLNTFLCLTCNRITPLDKRLQHLSPVWHCNVCDQDLHLDWKGLHLERHEVRGEVGPERQEQPRYKVEPVDVVKEEYNAGERHQKLVGGHGTAITPLSAPTRNMTGGDGAAGVEAAPFPMVDQSANTLCELPNVTPSPPPSSVFTCMLCRLTISISSKASHLGGKKHQKALRTAGEDKMQESAYCGFCKTPVLEAVELHLASDAHRRAMQSAVPGGQTVNKSNGWTQETFHCEVCEQALFVADREKHLHGAMHADAARSKKAVEDMMRIPAADVEASNLGALSRIYYCDFCNVDILSGVETHMASMPHKKAVCKAKRTALSPVNVEPQTAVSNPTATAPTPAVATTMLPPNATYYCDICSRNVFTSCQEEHLAGTVHTRALNMASRRVELEANLAARGDGMHQSQGVSASAPATQAPVQPPKKASAQRFFFCSVCNTSKSIAKRLGHEKSKKHKKNLLAREQAMKAVGSQARMEARSCGIEPTWKEVEGTVKGGVGSVPAEEDSKDAEFTTTPESQPLSQLDHSAQPNAFTLQSQSSTTRLYCDACERQLNTPTGFVTHMQGKTHRALLEAKIASKHKHPCATWYCSVCETLVHEDWWDNHIQRTPHVKRQAEKTATAARTDSTSGEPDSSYCTSCNMRPKDMARHMLTKGHRIKMPDYKPPDGKMFCKLCRNEYPLKQRFWHLSALWECDVCEKIMHKVSRESHLKGARHAKREAKKKEMVMSGGVSTVESKCKEELGYVSGETDSCANATSGREALLDRVDQMVRHRALENNGPTNPEMQIATGTDPDIWKCTLPDIEMPSPSRKGYEARPQYTSRQECEEQEEDHLTGRCTSALPAKPVDPRIESFRCLVCVATYGPDDRHLHSTPPWHCETCDTVLHTSAKSDHLSSDSHHQKESTPKENNIKPSLTPASEDTFFCIPCRGNILKSERRFHYSPAYHCALCELTIHADTRDIHEWSPSHSQAVEVATARPVNRTEMFSCQTCKKVFPATVQPFHRSRAWTCELCEVTVHMDWIGAHLMSDGHVARAKEVEGKRGGQGTGARIYQMIKSSFGR